MVEAMAKVVEVEVEVPHAPTTGEVAGTAMGGEGIGCTTKAAVATAKVVIWQIQAAREEHCPRHRCGAVRSHRRQNLCCPRSTLSRSKAARTN